VVGRWLEKARCGAEPGGGGPGQSGGTSRRPVGPGGDRWRRATPGRGGRADRAGGRATSRRRRQKLQLENEVFRVPRCWARGDILGAGYETIPSSVDLCIFVG
jgi:hypothetical protein